MSKKNRTNAAVAAATTTENMEARQDAMLANESELVDIATASDQIAPESTETPAAESTTDTVTVEEPKSETPAAELKDKVTPVEDRGYYHVADPAKPFKGKQRQIVAQILKDLSIGENAISPTIKQVTTVAKKAGLVAKGGVEPSVRYHLHHLVLLGYAAVVNPTYKA